MATSGYNQAETLEKLERLTQLETVVAEQRIRIEKYRTMYETLKTEHTQGEDVINRKDNEIINLRSELQQLEDRYQQAIEQTKAERDAKTQECEELRVQMMTPQRIEVLKMKIQEEVEAPYRQKVEALELENDQCRNTFNKIRYDYAFLKSEYEHEQSQHKAIIQELQTQHQLELDAIVAERDSLLQKFKSNESTADTQKLRTLQRDNAQLNLKIRSLLTELEEIREQREASGLQSDHVSRLQARQMTELSTKCKSLEAENETLRAHSFKLQSEHERVMKEEDDLTGKVYKLERDNATLRNQLSELEHSHKIDLSNLRIDLTKNRGEIERERDTVKQELETYKSKVKILEQNIEHLKSDLSLKEQDATKRIQLAQESEWEKISNLEAVKLQLESQLEDYDKSRLLEESHLKKKIEDLENQNQALQEGKTKIEKEVSNLKSQLNQHNLLKRDLEEERLRSQEMKRKSQNLQNDIEKLLTVEQENKAHVDNLKDTIGLLRKEAAAANMENDANLEDVTKGFREQMSKLENDKRDLSGKMTELQKQVKNSKKNEEKLKLLSKRRDKKRKQEIEELTEQISLLKAKEERLEAEKQAMEKNLNLEHERTKRRLDKLKKCHIQFNRMLNASGTGLPELSFTGGTPFMNTAFDPIPKGTPLMHGDLDLDQGLTPGIGDDI